MGKENREVKSSVLVDLMYEDESAEENERSFYNALHEEQLPNNIEIKKLRVENVVYMNFKNEFRENVIEYFINEYKNGRTPNPCIACNRYVKWESLLKRSMAFVFR